VIQGVCELLPVSSSAHVILAEKLMGIDPTAPEMTLLLVMLHTGTMLAVIMYFWRSWRARYFRTMASFATFAKEVVIATALTGAIGVVLLLLIERVGLRGSGHAEVELIFGNPYIIAAGLTAVGLMIIFSSRRSTIENPPFAVGPRGAIWIGAIQGLCLPFRGFSRSGSTISTGLLLGLDKARVEDFSFALAVVLTPPIIAREGYRVLNAHAEGLAGGGNVFDLMLPSLIGMALSFVAGLAALHWLSRWLEQGRWHIFGYYCLFAAAAVLAVAHVLG
jgi:undecaprenyl-diphosphatase